MTRSDVVRHEAEHDHVAALFLPVEEQAQHSFPVVTGSQGRWSLASALRIGHYARTADEMMTVGEMKPGRSMGILTEEMRRVVEAELGFIATVCPAGPPISSQRGTRAEREDAH